MTAPGSPALKTLEESGGGSRLTSGILGWVLSAGAAGGLQHACWAVRVGREPKATMDSVVCGRREQAGNEGHREGLPGRPHRCFKRCLMSCVAGGGQAQAASTESESASRGLQPAVLTLCKARTSHQQLGEERLA